MEKMEEDVNIKEYQKVRLATDLGEMEDYYVSRILKHDDGNHLRLTSVKSKGRSGRTLIVIQFTDKILEEKEIYPELFPDEEA